jgi:hypothetical protein
MMFADERRPAVDADHGFDIATSLRRTFGLET